MITRKKQKHPMFIISDCILPSTRCCGTKHELIGLPAPGLPERRDRVQNGLFQGFTSVAVHRSLVLFPMGQVARAADAAVHAGHAFNEFTASR